MTDTLLLGARLDTASVPALVADLRARAGADVVLDAANVAMVGGLAAQALMVAKRAWDRSGHRLSVVHLSDEARDQLALLGLTDGFEPLAEDRA